MTQIETPSYEIHVWRTAIFILGAIVLATEVFEVPGFWSSYARDLVGPAVIYLLFRGRHRASEARVFWGLRTPDRVVVFSQPMQHDSQANPRSHERRPRLQDQEQLLFRLL